VRLDQALNRSRTPVQARFGTVTAVNPGICTVKVAGGEIPVIYLKGGAPSVGDFVRVHRQGVVSYLLNPSSGGVVIWPFGDEYGPDGPTYRYSASGTLGATGPGGTVDKYVAQGMWADGQSLMVSVQSIPTFVYGYIKVASGSLSNGPFVGVPSTLLSAGAFDAKTQWWAAWDTTSGYTLAVYDLSGATVANFPVESAASTTPYAGLTYWDGATGTVWAPFGDSSGVIGVAIAVPATGALTLAYPLGYTGSVFGLGVDSGHGVGYTVLYSYPFTNAQVLLIDSSTGALLGVVSLAGVALNGLLADTKRGVAYVPYRGTNGPVLAVVTSSGLLAAEVPYPAGATYPAGYWPTISPDGATAFFGASTNSGYAIAVLDCATQTFTGAFPVPDQPAYLVGI